jgi:hypothetical protein
VMFCCLQVMSSIFFFMVVRELSIGQTRILCCLELVVDGVRVLYYMKKFSTDEKLSSWI